MEPNTYLLEWTSNSHTPIEEFELSWRKEGGEWEIFPIPSHRVNSMNWAGKWSFSNLETATRYEAKVMAKNREGWSRRSPSYHFATFGAGKCLQIDTFYLDKMSRAFFVFKKTLKHGR